MKPLLTVLAPLSAVLCCLMGLGQAAADPAPRSNALVHVEFDTNGLSRFESLGTTLVAPEDRRTWFFKLSFRKPDGSNDSRFSNRVVKSHFDPATRTLTQDSEWASMTVRYEVSEQELLCEVTLRNNDPALPLVSWEVAPIYLRLPRVGGHENLQVSSLGAVPTHATGTLGIMSLTPDVRFHFRQAFIQPSGAVPMFVSEPISRVSNHPIVHDDYFNIPPVAPIQPGQSRTCRVVFRPGQLGQTVTQIFPNYRAMTREFTRMELNWPDRRPIGMIFMAHPARNWKTNPRGYNFGRGEKHDVFNEEGLAIFRKELLEYADRNIEILKANNAQGVIVWNLEGEEKPHQISYVGDPRVLPQVAPEMERFADEFMGKFKAAGLKTGLTLRPTEFFNRSPDQPEKRDWLHREVPDPVALMSEKIEYAKKRWGTTIFYLDSNVFNQDWVKFEKDANIPWVMPVEMIRMLNLRHPDVLVIPEWADWQYYRYSAPYGSPNLGESVTYPHIQETVPGAFRVVALGTRLVEEQFDRHVTGVAGGDILMFQSWFTNADQAWMKLVYQQVALQRAIENPNKPLGWDVSSDEIERFRKAHALATQSGPQALAQTLALLDDPSPLVRRAVLRSIARQPALADASVPQRLLDMLTVRRATPPQIVLMQPAAEALGAMGEIAVPSLLKMLDDQPPRPANQPIDDSVTRSRRMALAALGLSRTKNPQVRQRILFIAESQEKEWLPLQPAAISATAKLDIREAIPLLLKRLEPDNKDEPSRFAAIEALGNLREPQAFVPIWNQFSHPIQQFTFLYQRDRIVNTALAQIAGAPAALGKDDWQRWMSRNPAATQPASR